MGILFLRLFWAIYFLGIALVLVNMISLILFSNRRMSFKEIGSGVMIAVIWPLCFFSGSGRKALFQIIRRL